MARTVGELGRLDVWVSNAGGSEHKGTYPLVDMPDEHWDAQLALNLRPHFIAAKACAAVMEPGSSLHRHLVDRRRCTPRPASPPTAPPRPAMNQLTQTHGRRAGATRASGPTRWRSASCRPSRCARSAAIQDEQLPSLAGQVPLGRLGDPSDVAAAAVYLASPAGSWVTGQTLAVSGGR